MSPQYQHSVPIISIWFPVSRKHSICSAHKIRGGGGGWVQKALNRNFPNDISEDSGKKEYKVKWVGYEEDLDTWEPEENIPKFIREYYKDDTKLKTKLPNPKIKYTKLLANGAKMHFLTWDGVTEAGDGQWVGEDWFDLASTDGDIVNTMEEGECGTRKSRDHQTNRM